MGHKRLSKRGVIYAVTAVSFAAIVLFLVFFTVWAPGHYSWDTDERSGADILFAVLLLVNFVCIVLSLIEGVKTCREAVREKRVSIKQIGSIILGLYPAVLILILSSGNMYTLCQYVLAPFRILLGL